MLSQLLRHKENREMTYAQAVAYNNKQNNVQENEDVKQILQFILH
jgi:hypothetical protein